MLTRRLTSLEHQLVSLNDRGNELRLLVDLPKIDEDTRKAGTGGTPAVLDFGLSPDVNGLLADLHAMMERTERELQLQAQSYREVTAAHEENKARFAHLPAIKPMDGYYSLQGFGMRLHPVLRIMKMHEGLDIANDVGTPVYATADGVVEFSGRTGGGYGIMIEIDHGYGYSTAYAHLSKTLVREGQRVRRGELIARSGRTGLVSGPHLHYEVRHKGLRLNPIDFFFDDIRVKDYNSQLASLD
jgi:murein DD-endopeptidase MepM/ murein hydrolase activator NlpD